MTAAGAGQPLPDNPWEKWGWAFAAIWLVFLAFPVIGVVESGAGMPAKVVAMLCIAGFAVANVLGYSTRLGSWWALGAMVVLALATVPVIGIGVISFTPYLAILSALELPNPWWKWAVGVWTAFPLLSLLDIDGFPTFFFLMLWPIMIGGVMLRLFGEREYAANAALREHAVVVERERVARDVHDVLGHSLTALSVKAELAARLIDLDPVRAKEELESIQATARQALAEVRATVGGLRAGNLEAELAAAPRVLADAGVETRVEGSVAGGGGAVAWCAAEKTPSDTVNAHAAPSHIRMNERVNRTGKGWVGVSDRVWRRPVNVGYSDCGAAVMRKIRSV